MDLKNRILIAASAALLCTVVASAQGPAGRPAPAPNWMELLRAEDGTRVSVDSATLYRTADSSWLVATQLEYASPLVIEGEPPIDREIDLEEVDCAAGNSRTLSVTLMRGDSGVVRRPLAAEWAPVSVEADDLFRARCAFLASSFAGRMEVAVDVSVVEERPSLMNRDHVAHLMMTAFQGNDDGGTVQLAATIGVDGRAIESTVVVSAPTEQAASAGRRVLGAMRFTPARMGGRAVPVRVLLPMTFVGR
jgi:hypothetical protein